MNFIKVLFFTFAISTNVYGFEDVFYSNFINKYNEKNKQEAIKIGKEFLTTYTKSKHWDEVYNKTTVL